MAKRPTQAAWVQALKTYEYLLNERIHAGADDDARRCLYAVHGLLRRRASGELREYEITSDIYLPCTDTLSQK